MKNITVIGVGKLGICFALQLEKVGFNIIGVDLNEEFVSNLNRKKIDSAEPNVDQYLKESKNFFATTDIDLGIQHSDIIFLFVATPSLNNGRYNHSQIDRVSKQIINFGKVEKPKHLIIGCTTMPGYCDKLKEELCNYGYTVTYNPEFIAQGSIMSDLVKPDIVLIGEDNKKIGERIKEIYSKLVINNPIYHHMSRKEAEITKIALNCFLTTKIAYANMVGDIAIASDSDPVKILNAIGSDSRIGGKNLKYGFGFGGPCFPRDNRALAIYAKEKGINALISEASDKSNNFHLDFQVKEFIEKNDVSVPVVITDLAYKTGTDIIEESQRLKFALLLSQFGYKIILSDTQTIIKKIKDKFGEIFEYEVKT